MNRQIVYSGLRTPDGTILTSKHRHDYVTYMDKSGKFYMLDGGLDYVRCSGNGDEELITVFLDEPFEKVRQYAYRIHPTGKAVPLNQMSNNWLEAAILWNIDRIEDGLAANAGWHISLLIQEKQYRTENEIFIDEEESITKKYQAPEKKHISEEAIREEKEGKSGPEGEDDEATLLIQELVEFAGEEVLRDRNHVIWRTIEYILSSHIGKAYLSAVLAGALEHSAGKH